jgi:hypothetical protein
LDDESSERQELRMKRPKLTVRPTGEELARLHKRAGRLGYSSLSAYLIDCGLGGDGGGGVLPQERRTLESLLLHVRYLTATVEEERRHRKSGILNPASPALLADLTRRSAEALRLINVILGRAAGGEESVEGEEAA